jgi:hypothetical protein
MHIKWQYKWFGNYIHVFFFTNPSELTFWLTYVYQIVNCADI